MAISFYYGTASKYDASTHSAGVYVCSDTKACWLHGQKITGLDSDSYNSLLETVSASDFIKAGTNITVEKGSDGKWTVACAVDTTLYVVVSALPSAPVSGNENKLHLVPASITGSNNTYAEYIWANSQWEKLGELAAEIDLSDYSTTTQVEALIATNTEELAKDIIEYVAEKSDETLASAKTYTDTSLKSYSTTTDMNAAIAAAVEAAAPAWVEV